MKKFLPGEDGQDLVEYCLLVGIVALGAVVALENFQGVISNVWQTISNILSGS
jgi:Flp pilus assembly pilin Flp